MLTANRQSHRIYVGLLWLSFISLPHTAHAVDVEQVIWGFDGRVIPYRFNVLSILVSNPTDQPYDVTLRLARATRVGADLDEAVFLSPFSSRWVQFYPYITSPQDQWHVAWGRHPSQRFYLSKPRTGDMARVILTQSDRVASVSTSLKQLPEVLFPPMVSATENLEAVFLDHAPRWQEARRQALLDWIYGGGKLFLMQGNDGEYPTFSAELSVLNAPLDQQRIWRRYGDEDQGTQT